LIGVCNIFVSAFAIYVYKVAPTPLVDNNQRP